MSEYSVLQPKKLITLIFISNLATMYTQTCDSALADTPKADKFL